ncbi:unnamed protein product, partial [Brassica napus]
GLSKKSISKHYFRRRCPLQSRPDSCIFINAQFNSNFPHITRSSIQLIYSLIPLSDFAAINM